MATESETAASEPLRCGQVIDGFRLEERTHEGGMAYLWRVVRVDGGDAVPLIMKLPRNKSGDDPTGIVGFEVEQMLLPALTGVHVPKFIAKGDDTHRPYIVMERIAGASLKPRFDAAPIPIDEVVRIGWKVATALHDLHRQHVVHLDVKPSNIMFRTAFDDSDGEAVLVDYGLAHHDHLPDLLEEEFELPLGTASYMSPEQLRHVRNDPRSDLFSLGVMLYHLCTGERPFGAPGSVRGLRQRLYRDPVPPRVLRADCPPWLQEVILRCLEVAPGHRHQSAAQLAFELQNPDQVALTQRAERTERSSTLKVVQRWFASSNQAKPEASESARSGRSPILLAAVDVAAAQPELLDAIRHAALRLMQTEPGARLACLTVMKASGTTLTPATRSEGEAANPRVTLLVQLKHWARPVVRSLGLGKPEQAGRVTFHVIEAGDAAVAVVDFARKNRVDHIVMGARSSGGLRRYLGSVSAQVAAEADCTVTVVRAVAGGD
jgi:eukaryotic-like serine/threonine-protein kinase